jgi:hypothetical protein
METRQSLRQRVANLASNEEGSTNAARYWRAVLPENWKGPYPPQWCGAFALWSLKTALGCPWLWQVGEGFLFRLRRTSEPDLGDICYRAHFQHHAVLTAVGNAADGKPYIIAQNGNAGDPPGTCLESFTDRGTWTAFYSIEPLLSAALAKDLP